MRRALTLALLVVALAGCGPASQCQDGSIRGRVVSGHVVNEVCSGGQWVKQ